MDEGEALAEFVLYVEDTLARRPLRLLAVDKCGHAIEIPATQIHQDYSPSQAGKTLIELHSYNVRIEYA